ncbi:MAG: type II toxin-antitoxin system VapB family antitoxin [Candidatus Latescibacterota bacterium]
MQSIAKLFQNGRSQAVRIPKAFRFKGTEVKIRKEGDMVILEPLEAREWPAGFWDDFKADPTFAVPAPLPTKPIDLDGDR